MTCDASLNEPVIAKGPRVKYSIVVPVHNAVRYLPACVDSVVRQDFEDYELIVSDDHSSDGTSEYLNRLVHRNVVVIHTPQRLSMAEHFEWALGHARGDWLAFVGGDDGLQPYFFALAERLTRMAEEKHVRSITSERAYFFWPGCERLYGQSAVSYRAVDRCRILGTAWQSILALVSFGTYFDLPQMYTTSLFHRSLIAEARKRQGGKLLSTVPADANLAAIACNLERKFVKSSIPLGWVGTSPGGVLYSMEPVERKRLLPNADFSYEERAGDFALRSCAVYFWNGLCVTGALQGGWKKVVLKTLFFRTILLGGVLAEIRRATTIDVESRLKHLDAAIKVNGCSSSAIRWTAGLLSVLYRAWLLQRRVEMGLERRCRLSIRYERSWGGDSAPSMRRASDEVEAEFESRTWRHCGR